VVLSLGSNLGDRTSNIIHAIEQIKSKYTILKYSKLYETKAQDDFDQDDFLNAALLLEEKGSAQDLLQFLQKIELGMKRVRDPLRPKGPRIIDLDIIFFSDQILETNELEVPHPRYKKRAFVLYPVLDLVPNAFDPRSGIKLVSILTSLEDQGVYSLDSPEYNGFTQKN
jgi:2-amino-4-hydroxy-6-hydroxymethyldihydropteridine diphosphokinase